MWLPGSVDTVCPCPSVTLTCDRLTLKLVCESHLRWGAFIPNFGNRPLGSRISHYVLDGRTDRQRDRRTDGRTKATLIASFPTVGGIINILICSGKSSTRSPATAGIANRPLLFLQHRIPMPEVFTVRRFTRVLEAGKYGYPY